jgi:hypothetical protein
MRRAGVVAKVNVETGESAGHGLADAAETKQPDLAAPQRVAERVIAVRPLALGDPPTIAADKLIRLAQTELRAEDETHGKIGHITGDGGARVGHPDPSALSERSVYAIEANAEAGDDLEGRQLLHHFGPNGTKAGGRNASDPIAEGGKNLLLLFRRARPAHHLERLLQSFLGWLRKTIYLEDGDRGLRHGGSANQRLTWTLPLFPPG